MGVVFCDATAESYVPLDEDLSIGGKMMAIRIGHASIDETGKISGGAAGDQNGKEVCIRNWYNGGWGFLARAKNAGTAEKIAAAC